MILHVEGDKFVDMHDNLFGVLLIFLCAGGVLVVFRWRNWRHHMLIIKYVIFIILFLIESQQLVLLMIAHPRSLNAGSGLLESTRAILNKVLFYLLSLFDIHASSQVPHGLRHLGTPPNSLKEITCWSTEPILWSVVQICFWLVGGYSAATTFRTRWRDSLGQFWALEEGCRRVVGGGSISKGTGQLLLDIVCNIQLLLSEVLVQLFKVEVTFNAIHDIHNRAYVFIKDLCLLKTLQGDKALIRATVTCGLKSRNLFLRYRTITG